MDPLLVLQHLGSDDRELVAQFFGAFAGAEFALKSMGYIGTDRYGGVSADWDAYASAITGRFRRMKDAEFSQAWDSLTSRPPRKQVIRNGLLSWGQSERPRNWSDERWALLLTRRVRNNLFHGAKFFLGGSEGYLRDRELVQAAIVVTRRALTDPPAPRKKDKRVRVSSA